MDVEKKLTSACPKRVCNVIAHVIDLLSHFAFNKENYHFIQHAILLTRRTLLLTFLSEGPRRRIRIKI